MIAACTPNPLWWVPAAKRSIEMMERAIAGRADHEKIRLPLGDATFEPVSAIRRRLEAERVAVAQAEAQS